MKPNVLIGLSSFFLWLPGLISLSLHNHSKQQVWIFPFLFILLSCFLFSGSKRAMFIYRGLLWLGLLVLIMLMLLSMSGINYMHELLTGITNSSSWGGAIVYTLVWILFLGWILYYSEKDHVRAAFGLEPKGKKKSAVPNAPENAP